jgi:hypothetical protein
MAGAGGTWAEARRLATYLAALRGFLREPLDEGAALERLRVRLEGREEAFLRLVEGAIFANPGSAYRPLLRRAGVEHADLVRLVRGEGLERTLARLDEAGVYVTVEELRGARPLVRDGVELDARGAGFENPLATTHYHARTGGSRSAGVPVAVDLARRESHAAYHALLLRAFGLERPPTAVWFPAPPAVAGLGTVLSHAKLGLPIERWFSQTDWRRGSPRHALFTAATLAAARASGTRLPRPEHTPPAAAVRVAGWLAAARSRGRTSLVASPSSAVRVCAAAREHGLELAGSFFRLSGEPFTPGLQAAIAEAGAEAAASYYMAEAGGALGIACAAAAVPDEVHVATDRVAVIERAAGPSGLLVTTLDPLSSSLLVNLVSGDSGVLGERECGCAIGELGLSLHLHSIRSAKKLTSEGMSFLGTEVIDLLEQVLPARFGGSSADYQLVELEEDGLSRIALVVSPRVGALDEAEVLRAFSSFLRSRGAAQRLMGEVWERSGTLRVMRREPYVTPGAKTSSVHVLRDQG